MGLRGTDKEKPMPEASLAWVERVQSGFARSS